MYICVYKSTNGDTVEWVFIYLRFKEYAINKIIPMII